MGDYCTVRCENRRLVCDLPLTIPTGKVRVLRQGQPVATRQTKVEKGDLIEWQISYFADNHTRLVELGELLRLALENRLTSKADLEQLMREIEGVREFFAESFATTMSEPHAEFHGFRVSHKLVPILTKEVDEVVIWIELGHKQRAVGFQPMLFLRLPIENVSPCLIGRTAEPNQLVHWEPTLSLVFETVKGFSICSRKHHHDMLEVLSRCMGD